MADWDVTTFSNAATSIMMVALLAPTASDANSKWNPSINSSCTDLLANDAYSVEGPATSTDH
ncbi:hypothetical protein N7495_009541 [Penicillium taxi]|uniref:uncharacterized protein n=1 Tax=Penicillium taxi TaxID=168475 RepID=UPI0025456A9D|nr:uncharacterized protein N7495_009541 [Penicillium taxi]KAJ5885031.1 hypothetical protein N7495_009541 [Penicillium taxi]